MLTLLLSRQQQPGPNSGENLPNGAPPKRSAWREHWGPGPLVLGPLKAPHSRWGLHHQPENYQGCAMRPLGSTKTNSSTGGAQGPSLLDKRFGGLFGARS